MCWTNMDEKEIIKAWAEKECTREIITKYLSMPENEKESYWYVNDEEEDIAEYAFETVPELRKILEKKLKEEFYKDLVLPCAVAVFKEGEIANAEKLDNEEDIQKDIGEFSIPEFVYVF